MFSLFRRKKQVIFYSMDRNVDAAALHALTTTPGLRTRVVRTLDRAKVAKLRVINQKLPRHVYNSEYILRHELGGKKPYFIVTLVSDVSPDFGSTKKWFSEEYLPATGIDVNATPFNHSEIARDYQEGPHRLLLLSAYASAADQQRILSKFLGVAVNAFDPKYTIHTATRMYRRGEITGPALLLRELPDARSQALYKNLAAQDRLLRGHFPFSALAQRSYTPNDHAVLYNAHQTLPFHTTGYATRTQGLARALMGQGWNMSVVSRAGYPKDTKIDPGNTSARTVDGVPYRCDLSSGHGQWDMPVDTYVDTAARYLVAQAQDLKPALIHTASNYMCGLAGVEAARRLGIPSIYEMRGLWHVTQWSKDPDYNKTQRFALAQKLELDAARGATRVIAITGALKEWLIEHGIEPAKISLAPNAVDLTQFAMRAPDTDFAQEIGCADKIVIGYVGSFVQYEGLDLLVEAVAMLPQHLRNQIKLLWMGDGPALAPTLAYAKKLDILDCIISLGRRPFEDVPRVYSIIDICAFPRKGQPVCEIVSPLKPFEAMAMEKAIVVSDVRPLQEIVQTGVTGLVHTKDDATSLSQQLERFIVNSHLRLSCGANARRWIESTRQWDIIAKDIGDVYKGLL